MVFLYVPNIIGYVRILLMLVALAVIIPNPWASVGFYTASQLLDMVDGYVARRLKQTSMFGAMLDQITDRLSTAALLMTLSAIYPSMYFAFTLILLCDIGGHWMHMHASICQKQSHKEAPTKIWLLEKYYKSKLLMLYAHASYEACLLSLAILPALQSLRMIAICVMLTSLPGFILKITTNVLQLISGSMTMGRLETSYSLGSRL